MKNYAILAMVVFTSGCTSLPTNSLPTYSYFNSFDEKSVSYMRNTPTVDLKELPSQEERVQQHLPIPNREVMFAVSGGGARAAAFTLGVMTELENLGKWTSSPRNIHALNEVDYYTTVSGGGWAVAAYLADRLNSDSEEYHLSDKKAEEIQKELIASSHDGNCLRDSLNRNITKGMTFGDIFPEKEPPRLPYLFSVGTILPSQSPFVFSDKIINYYKVDHLYACGKSVDIKANNNFKDIDVAYAIATSGSVPGFRHSTASTKICEDLNLKDSFFCSQGHADYTHLVLADGGIYDNYGYLSAAEILNTLPPNGKVSKALIIIDANADTESQFVNDPTDNSLLVAKNALLKAGFPARTAAFNRLRKPMLKAMNIDSYVIDFYSTADYTRKSQEHPDKDYLEGLDDLRDFAKTRISCFADDGRYLTVSETWKDWLLFRSPQRDTQKERSASRDCKANNFYRTGLSNKTTYLNDKNYFPVLNQLGRLAVRLNADNIYKAIYGVK